MSNLLQNVIPVRVLKMSGISKAGNQYSISRLEYLLPARGFSNDKTTINAIGFEVKEINLSETAFSKFAELPFLTHCDFILTCDPRDPTKNIVADWAPAGN